MCNKRQISYHRQSALYYIRDHTHQKSLVLVQRLEKQKAGTQNTKETKNRPTAHIHLYMGHYYRYMVVVFCRRSKFAVWEITLQGRSTNGYLRAPAHSETIASPKKRLMSEHLSPYEYSPYLTEISKGELKYQMNSLHKGKAQVKYILFLFPIPPPTILGRTK